MNQAGDGFLLGGQKQVGSSAWRDRRKRVSVFLQVGQSLCSIWADVK